MFVLYSRLGSRDHSCHLDHLFSLRLYQVIQVIYWAYVNDTLCMHVDIIISIDKTDIRIRIGYKLEKYIKSSDLFMNIKYYNIVLKTI